MANFKTISTIVVDCSDWGFGPFEVLVVPHECQSHPCYDFYLRHPRYGIVIDMGGVGIDTPLEEAAEMAYYSAIDYIPDFIKGCNDDD